MKRFEQLMYAIAATFSGAAFGQQLAQVQPDSGPGGLIVVAIIAAVVGGVIFLRKKKPDTYNKLVGAAQNVASEAKSAVGKATSHPAPAPAPAPAMPAPLYVPAPPVSIAPAAPAAPEMPIAATPNEAYIDRDDMMKDIGARNIQYQISIDGKLVHNGIGPGFIFFTQPNGNVTQQKPAAVTAPPAPPVQAAPPTPVQTPADPYPVVSWTDGNVYYSVEPELYAPLKGKYGSELFERSPAGIERAKAYIRALAAREGNQAADMEAYEARQASLPTWSEGTIVPVPNPDVEGQVAGFNSLARRPKARWAYLQQVSQGAPGHDSMFLANYLMTTYSKSSIGARVNEALGAGTAVGLAPLPETI